MTAKATPWTARRWIVTVLVASGALVCLLCVAGVGLYAARQHGGRREALDAVLADLRARGEPVGADDLVPPTVPVDEDGGPLLREAWAWLEAQGGFDEIVPPEAGMSRRDFDVLPAGRREEIRTAIEELAPFVEMVVRALERPRWRPLDRDDVGAAVTRTDRDVADIQHTVRVVTLAACSLPDDAPPETRARLLGAVARLGARWAAPQSAIQWLVATTLQTTALQRAREGLELGRIEPADMRREFADVLDADIRARADRVLQLDRAEMIDVVRRWFGDDPRPVAADGSVPKLGEGGLAGLSRALFIDHLDDVAALLADRQAPWTSLVRRARRIERSRRPLPWRKDLGRSLSTGFVLIPGLLGVETRLATQQRLALCALAALAHRGRSGAWPVDLDALDVPTDARIDPYTDAALLYEVLPDGGLRIASAGPVDPAIWGEDVVDDNDPAADGLIWHLR